MDRHFRHRVLRSVDQTKLLMSQQIAEIGMTYTSDDLRMECIIQTGKLVERSRVRLQILHLLYNGLKT